MISINNKVIYVLKTFCKHKVKALQILDSFALSISEYSSTILTQ